MVLWCSIRRDGTKLSFQTAGRMLIRKNPPSNSSAQLNAYGIMPYNGDRMKSETSTTARLEARLPNTVLTRLKRAAEIQGRTLTDFVVAAADEAACRAIEKTEIIRLSLEDQRRIAKALLNPPRPNAALKRAFKRRRQLLGVE